MNDSDLSEEYNSSDEELQEALATGKLKPGLNIAKPAPKQFTNNTKGLAQKLQEFKLDLPWIETLSIVSKQAPLAPEMAAQILQQEQRRENLIKNNKKLPQISLSQDPVLNDFKREMGFYRQAQSTVTEAIPRLKNLGIPTKRPDDYFAEMAKSDEHMQKIRQNLTRLQHQQHRTEKVKQLRLQRKEGKAIQAQKRLEREQEKKQFLAQVKKSKNKGENYLDKKQPQKNNHKVNNKTRAWKDKKFGFGGKKRNSKQNTKASSTDISEYRRPKLKGKDKQKRPGKNRRIKQKSHKK